MCVCVSTPATVLLFERVVNHLKGLLTSIKKDKGHMVLLNTEQSFYLFFLHNKHNKTLLICK